MRQIGIAAIAAIIGFGFVAGPAQAVTFTLTLQDTTPGGVSGTGTVSFASALTASTTYTPGAAVTLLDFNINSQDFNETNAFTSIHTNSSSMIDAITLTVFAPGFLTTGGLTFTYSGNGQFGSGVIDVTAGTSATPLPATLPLFASGLGVVGLLVRRRKRKPAFAA